MDLDFSFNYDGKKFTYKDIKDDIIDETLTVSAKIEKYIEYDATECVLWFENVGDKDSKVISDINDCDTVLPFEIDRTDRRDMYIPKKTDLCVISMNGMVESDRYWENAEECAIEYTFNRDYLYKLPNNKKVFANRGGRSSDKIMPFFDVTQNGKGYIVAVGWTGDWKAEFIECENGVKVKTGLKETAFYLKSREKVRTSSVLIMEYNENEDKYNKFRGLIKNHFSHIACTKAEKEGLLAFGFFGTVPSDDMKKKIKMLKSNGLNFEEVWIDAGWYGKCRTNIMSDWDSCVGEWNINKDTHPKGLIDVAECTKENGMSLMFWVEPERARSGGTVITKHPDWFLSTEGTTNNILNLGNEDAWNYVYDLISNYIKDLDISCYRQDYNVPLTTFFASNDEKNRRGITEIKHIMGLYRLWDSLLKKYPKLIIDNCSSGGRRIDIETLKRSIPFFRSDYFCNNNADAEVVQVQNNLSRYLPYIGGCTNADDLYSIRSSYASSFGCGNMWSEIFKDAKRLELLKNAVQEYKKIRKYFSKDFYMLGADVYDTSSWTVWQYHDKETDSGILMAFRRSESPFGNMTVELQGTQKGKTYIYTNLDTKEQKKQDNTIKIEIPEKRSCTIIEYKGVYLCKL